MSHEDRTRASQGEGEVISGQGLGIGLAGGGQGVGRACRAGSWTGATVTSMYIQTVFPPQPS